MVAGVVGLLAAVWLSGRRCGLLVLAVCSRQIAAAICRVLVSVFGLISSGAPQDMFYTRLVADPLSAAIGQPVEHRATVLLYATGESQCTDRPLCLLAVSVALVAAIALRKFVLDILPRGVFGAVSHLTATALVAAGLVHLHQWMEQRDGGLFHWGCVTCFWLLLDIVRSTTSHSSVLVV